MKKLWILPVAILFLLTSCRKEEQKTENIQEFRFKVKVAKAEVKSFEKFINYKGTVYAWQTANITPEVSGRIARIYRKVGEEVRSGELLAELDLTSLKLQLRQAVAVCDVAEKNYQDAKLNYDRMENLFNKKAVSSYQYEKAQLAYASARTQLESARANLEIVKYNISMSYMRAPFSGIVSAKNMEEGDMINPGMGTGQSVLELLDLSKVKVVVDLTAEDVEKVNIGQECRVKPFGMEDEVSGQIYSKNLAADLNTKTFRVEIVVKNDEKRIKANIFADVRIEIEKKENVLTLPLSALLQEKYVMVVENGRARKVEIVKGIANENEFIVEQGVSAGQNVIVEGNYDLQEGQAVVF